MKRAFDSLKKVIRNSFLLFLLSVILVLFQTGFIFPSAWKAYGMYDWDLTYFTAETARICMEDYGQMPLWNPWSRGGLNLFSNPLTFHFGPFFPLSFIFSVPIFLKLNILLMYLMGFWGMFFFLRKINTQRIFAYAGAGIFSFCTYFSWHSIFAGHHNVLGIFWLPWFLFFYHDFKTKGLTLFNFLLPLLLALFLILDGSSYPAIYTPLFIVSYVLADVFSQKPKRWQLLFYPLVIFALGYGSLLWKIYPSLVWISQFSRVFEDNTATNLLGLLRVFAEWQPVNQFNSLSYWGWWEYGASFEVWAILLLIIFYKRLNLSWPWLLLLALWLWLSMGNFPKYFNPWYFLNHYVSFFKTQRVPSRIIIYLIFLLSIFTVRLFQTFRKRKIVYLLFAIWFIHLGFQNYDVYQHYQHSPAFAERHLDLTPSNDLRLVTLPEPDGPKEPMLMYRALKKHYGIINSYEPHPIPIAHWDTASLKKPLPLVEQPWVEIKKWTPAKVMFALKEIKPFIYNQNYEEGWEMAAAAGTLEARDGKIFIRPKKEDVTIYFSPPNLKMGILMSILPWLLVLATIAYLVFNKRILLKNQWIAS